MSIAKTLWANHISRITYRASHTPYRHRFLPLLTLALAVLPAASPYFGAGLPRTNDALPHLYRALVLDRLVRAGVLWPRWSPDLVHGYGYPVFHFFPALSHYLVILYHLVGLPLTTAYRAAVLTHFILAAWCTYLLARDLFGPAGGWTAALAYVYSPYFLYDVIVRGGLPESQALAFFPLLLFALRRAALRSGRWIAINALAFAAVFLSHFPITVQLFIPIGLVLAWLGWEGPGSGLRVWRSLWRPLAGLAIGVLLTAAFWLPTLTEVQHVRANLSISQGYSYRDNFITLRELLTWPRLPADPALVNPPVVRALPQVALALAALGLAWRWRWLNRTARRQVGLWMIVLTICTVLVTPFSRFVWDHITLLNLTLYPWRFLGPASLAGALLLAAVFAGAQVGQASQPQPNVQNTGALAFATLLIVVAAIPWLYPPREPVSESPTIADLVAFEQPPLFIGTTTLGEFLPRWVEELPDTGNLAASLAAGESPDRLVVPDGVIAFRLRGSVLDATYRITATVPAALTYRQFYFPGWQAMLDEAPLSIRPSQPHGLILMDIPAGEHILRVRFGTTPPRVIGWAVSGLGMLSLLVILIHHTRSRPTNQLANQRTGQPANQLILLASLVLLLKLFFDHVDTPLRRPMLGAEGLRGVQYPLAVDFASELLLLGYDLTPPIPPPWQGGARGGIPADADIELTLYWRPLRPIGVVYIPVVHVVDESGLTWDVSATRPRDWRFAPGTDFWPLDGYVMDPYVLRLADGTPPGPYTFRVSLVRRDTDQTVARHDIGTLVVAQPARGERPLEGGMTPAADTQTWGGLRLLGSRTDRAEAAPGDPVRVTLLWQATGPVADDGRVTLRLVEQAGTAILTTTVPVAAHYPPDRWQSGDRLRSESLLRLPARTSDGRHIWQVQLAPQAPVWPAGTLRVRAPERLWTAPPLAIRTDTLLGNVATLLGANLQSTTCDLQPAICTPQSTLTVTLVWRAEAETSISYRVFLHLTDPDGKIVAQSDGEPANWSRPTTSWLPGEIVLDERILTIPADASPGEYVLSCGLYDLASSVRLTGADGADAVPLFTITIR